MFTLKNGMVRDGLLPTLASIFMLAAAASLLYILGIIIYRLTSHPLANYPGPLSGRITDWFMIYHSWLGDRHAVLYKLHEKHGLIVRFGPNRISVATNTGLREIYGYKANVRKSSWYSVFNEFFTSPSTFTHIDRAKHGRCRRVLSQALSDAAIKAMEEHILKNSRIFCHKLAGRDEGFFPPGFLDDKDAKPWSIAKDITNWSLYLAFDVMGDICFSQSYEMLVNVANRFILEVIGDGVMGLALVAYMPRLVKLQIDKILFRKLTKGTRDYEKFSNIQATEREKLGVNVPTRDVFSFLLEAKDPDTGEGFTVPELISETSLLIVAGSDTTATTISAAFAHLLDNPHILQTLTHEILSTFPTLESIRLGPVLSSCRYLRACIEETLRVNPAVPGALLREVLPGGLNVDGYHFPAGIDICTPIWTLHHHQDYFPNPWTYMPERWLLAPEQGDSGVGIATKESLALAYSAFSPFSIGPRSCVGRVLAYAEMSLVIARVIWQLEMRLEPGWKQIGDGVYPIVDKFVARGHGPMIEFRERTR